MQKKFFGKLALSAACVAAAGIAITAGLVAEPAREAAAADADPSEGVTLHDIADFTIGNHTGLLSNVGYGESPFIDYSTGQNTAVGMKFYVTQDYGGGSDHPNIYFGLDKFDHSTWGNQDGYLVTLSYSQGIALGYKLDAPTALHDYVLPTGFTVNQSNGFLFEFGLKKTENTVTVYVKVNDTVVMTYVDDLSVSSHPLSSQAWVYKNGSSVLLNSNKLGAEVTKYDLYDFKGWGLVENTTPWSDGDHESYIVNQYLGQMSATENAAVTFGLKMAASDGSARDFPVGIFKGSQTNTGDPEGYTLKFFGAGGIRIMHSSDADWLTGLYTGDFWASASLSNSALRTIEFGEINLTLDTVLYNAVYYKINGCFIGAFKEARSSHGLSSNCYTQADSLARANLYSTYSDAELSEKFAKAFIDGTATECAAGAVTNGNWANLNTLYTRHFNDATKALFATATADAGATAYLNQAAARYDVIVAKYTNYADFADRSSSRGVSPILGMTSVDNGTFAMMGILMTLGFVFFFAFLAFSKRKHE